MTIPITLVVGPLATANAALIVASVTPVSGTALTLTSNPVTLDRPRRILATFGNETAARTLTITGTNADGNPIQEALAIPSGGSGTVYTVQDFATVTTVFPTGGGWSAALVVGTNTVASSPWKIVNTYFSPTEISFSGVISGTVNWGIEYTYSTINSNADMLGSQAIGNYPAVPVTFNHAMLQNISGQADGNTNVPIFAWRAKINSGSGTLTVTAIEGGIIVQR